MYINLEYVSYTLTQQNQFNSASLLSEWLLQPAAISISTLIKRAKVQRPSHVRPAWKTLKPM